MTETEDVASPSRQQNEKTSEYSDESSLQLDEEEDAPANENVAMETIEADDDIVLNVDAATASAITTVKTPQQKPRKRKPIDPDADEYVPPASSSKSRPKSPKPRTSKSPSKNKRKSKKPIVDDTSDDEESARKAEEFMKTLDDEEGEYNSEPESKAPRVARKEKIPKHVAEAAYAKYKRETRNIEVQEKQPSFKDSLEHKTKLKVIENKKIQTPKRKATGSKPRLHADVLVDHKDELDKMMANRIPIKVKSKQPSQPSESSENPAAGASEIVEEEEEEEEEDDFDLVIVKVAPSLTDLQQEEEQKKKEAQELEEVLSMDLLKPAKASKPLQTLNVDDFSFDAPSFVCPPTVTETPVDFQPTPAQEEQKQPAATEAPQQHTLDLTISDSIREPLALLEPTQASIAAPATQREESNTSSQAADDNLHLEKTTEEIKKTTASKEADSEEEEEEELDEEEEDEEGKEIQHKQSEFVDEECEVDGKAEEAEEVNMDEAQIEALEAGQNEEEEEYNTFLSRNLEEDEDDEEDEDYKDEGNEEKPSALPASSSQSSQSMEFINKYKQSQLSQSQQTPTTPLTPLSLKSPSSVKSTRGARVFKAAQLSLESPMTPLAPPPVQIFAKASQEREEEPSIDPDIAERLRREYRAHQKKKKEQQLQSSLTVSPQATAPATAQPRKRTNVIGDEEEEEDDGKENIELEVVNRKFKMTEEEKELARLTGKKRSRSSIIDNESHKKLASKFAASYKRKVASLTVVAPSPSLSGNNNVSSAAKKRKSTSTKRSKEPPTKKARTKKT